MKDTKITALWLILIGAFIAALYGQFLHNPLVFDDVPLLQANDKGYSNITAYISPALSDLRALPYATLAWSKAFDLKVPAYRIVNLLLHWAVVTALGFFILHLYRRVLPKDEMAGENTRMTTAVLIVVGLFALHPLAVYAVAYLVERTIVMATLFSVLTLWAYLHGSDKQSSRWLWGSVALYFLATHSKEHVIMLPALLVAMTVLLHEDWRARLVNCWPIMMAFAAIALFTIAQRKGVIGHLYEVYSDEMLQGVSRENAYGLSVLTQCWLFFKYGLLWLLPNPAWMSIDMREPLAPGLFSVYGFALLAYIGYGFISIKLLIKKGKIGLIGFAMLFPWLMFMTEFSTPRVQELFVLYRSYIWALGGVIVFPMLLMQLNARLTMLISVLIAATLFMVSMERLSSFSHPILLWDDAEKLVKERQSLPGVSRIYYNRGTAWLNEDRVDLAIKDMRRAEALSPKFSPIYFNLGIAYFRFSQFELATQAYSRAISLDEEQKRQPNFRYYYGRGMVYEAQYKYREASADYQVSCLLAKKGCDKTSLH